MNPGNWNILFHWRIIVTQFYVFACYSRLQKIQQNIEGTTIYSQLPTKKIHGNFSVIAVLPQSTGRVDVPSVSVFYGVQPLKELLGVLEIDALILSSSYASFRLPSERNLKQETRHKLKHLNVFHCPAKTFDGLARTADWNMISALF